MRSGFYIKKNDVLWATVWPCPVPACVPVYRLLPGKNEKNKNMSPDARKEGRPYVHVCMYTCRAPLRERRIGNDPQHPHPDAVRHVPGYVLRPGLGCLPIPFGIADLSLNPQSVAPACRQENVGLWTPQNAKTL